MASKTNDDDEPNALPEWANVDFGEIELGDRIGGGGVGIIYKGYWKGEPVALKTLFDSRIGQDLKKEYMDELLVMSKVSHTNIVKFLGACMTPPNLCFIMEICECSLFDLLHVQRVQLSMQDNMQLAVRKYSFVALLDWPFSFLYQQPSSGQPFVSSYRDQRARVSFLTSLYFDRNLCVFAI